MTLDPTHLTPLVDPPRRILVLDDDQDSCSRLSSLGQTLSLEVDCVRTCQQARALLDTNAYALVVTVIYLPGDNGLVFAKALRDHPQFADCPLIIMSARFSAADLSKVEQAFTNSLTLVKPFQGEDFLAILNHVVPDLTHRDAPVVSLAAITDNLDTGTDDAAAHSGTEAAPLVSEASPGPEHLKLVVDLEKMKVFAVAVTDERETRPDEALVRAELEQQGVGPNAINQAVLGQLIADMTEGSIEHDAYVEIASGRLPVNGEDGRVDFLVNVSGQAENAIKKTDRGSLDYRDAVRMTTVREGECLARIVPPTGGTDGQDLAGQRIGATPGSPVKLRAGGGVVVKGEPAEYTAERAGVPRYRDGTLLVDPVMVIEENVSLKTGNIIFEGDVIVRGDVLDGFNITGHSVEVSGVIGAASIDCSGDLVGLGGVAGRDGATLTVEGNATFKYISQAALTVAGDVQVFREVDNSTIHSRGRIKAAQIMGGKAVALHGIEVGEAGSDMCVLTTLEPGVDYQVEKIEERLGAIEGELDTLIKPAREVLGNRVAFKKLDPELQTKIRESQVKVLELCQIHDELMITREELSQGGHAVCEVRVLQILHPDVVIRSSGCVSRFQKMKTGPVTLVPDIDSGTIQAKAHA